MSVRAYALASTLFAIVAGTVGCGGEVVAPPPPPPPPSCVAPIPMVETDGTASFVVASGQTALAQAPGFAVTASVGNPASSWSITILDDSAQNNCFIGYVTGQGALSDLSQSGGVAAGIDSTLTNQITFASVGSGNFTFTAPNDTSATPADIYVDVFINGAAATDSVWYFDGTTGASTLTHSSYVAFNVQ